MERITSLKNPKVQGWKALKERKGRRESGCFLVEGFKMVEEALAIQTGCGRALTEGLTPEETELLRSILKKVMDNVERLAGKETLE